MLSEALEADKAAVSTVREWEKKMEQEAAFMEPRINSATHLHASALSSRRRHSTATPPVCLLVRDADLRICEDR